MNNTYSMDEQIGNVITQILIDRLGVSETQITEEASFMKDLGVDSLDYAEFVMELEQTFNISIPDTDAVNLQTVGEAINYIEKRQR
jgi:acyl carrier protein